VVGIPTPDPTVETDIPVLPEVSREPIQQDSSVVSETELETRPREPEPIVEVSERPVSLQNVRRSSVRALRGILKKPRQEVPPAPKVEVVQETPIAAEPERTVQILKDMEDTEDDKRTKRASLKLAAFDRLMFAKRGAELRDEYMMRDISEI
jgi:hypothetical protein